MQPNQDGGAERAPGQSGGLRACVLSSQACASHHRGSLRGAGGHSLLPGAPCCSFQLLAAGVRRRLRSPDPQPPAGLTQAWSRILPLPFLGCAKVT